MRARKLTDPATGKTWSTRCDDANVLVRAGLPGKEKDSVKPQASAEDALDWAEKEEWTRLKKGFVLDDPGAPPGAPRMHRFRGRGYTGALPIEDVGGQLLCNWYDPERPGDKLFLLDEHGVSSSLPELPGNGMAWRACHVPSLDKLLVKADHQVVAWTAGAAAFEVLCVPNRHSVSCLHVAGSRAVWYAEPDLVVTELATGGTLLRLPLAYEMYGNHSPQMEAAISPDGATVACCSQAGEIDLIDVATGKILGTLSGDFLLVVKMSYTPDGRFLIVSEQYGHCRTLCFDIDKMALRSKWIETGYSTFALSADGARIAIAQRRHIEVFDFATLKRLLRFRVDHMVKRCSIAWVGRYLGVQTDYGCASLYALARGAGGDLAM